MTAYQPAAKYFPVASAVPEIGMKLHPAPEQGEVLSRPPNEPTKEAAAEHERRRLCSARFNHSSGHFCTNESKGDQRPLSDI